MEMKILLLYSKLGCINMKILTKSQKARKEAQIKALISTALNYFYAEDLLEMLMNECTHNGKDDLTQKCCEYATIGGDMLVTNTTLVTERLLKDFCKQNDIKLKTYFEV